MRELVVGVVATAILGLPAPARAAPFASGDECYKCHARMPRDNALGEHVSEYEVSAHGRLHVSCAKCHGGDSTTPDKAKGHVGVKPQNDATSRVHAQHQPETCGECHPKVLRSFSMSKHRRALTGPGTGPTCTTCHTAMGSGILSSEEVANTCRSCHKAGGQAKDKGQSVYAARLLVEVLSTQRTLRISDVLVRWAERGGVKVPGADRLRKAKEKFGGAAEAWHVFDPVRTRDSVDQVADMVDQVRLDLETLETGKPIVRRKPDATK